jgi:hypothetical protein
MANTNRQYKDSARFTFGGMVGIILLIGLMLLTSCTGTYYITDSEYSDVRESHASLTYHNNLIYWGWDSGYYYYYGTPHYYPWYYYYNTCPPSHYTHTTHVIISRPVNRPTHRPNKPKVNTHRSNIKVKTNVNRNKINIKTNRSNNSNKRSTNTRRRPK